MRPIARECLDERSQGIGDGNAGDQNEKDRPYLVEEPQRDRTNNTDGDETAYPRQGIGTLRGSALKAIVEVQESVPIRPVVDRQPKRIGPRTLSLTGGGRREVAHAPAPNVDHGG
jgi:hypothetical protein